MSHAVVFPSSTSRDLPEFRAAVLEACRELNLGVATMEDFPAAGHGATQGSFAQLDKCDVYLGVFAYRYGYVEPGYPCSVTEAEYDHARKRGLECLCFFVAADVAWPEERTEHDALKRVQALAQRIQGEQIVNWFRSADDLKHKAYRALDDWLERTGRRPRGPRQIPTPPADFVGRENEIAFLLNGFERGASIFGARGLGGVGKTTLAQVLAQRLASRFPDGQLYLDLRGVGDNPVSWRDALAHVIHAYRPEERLPDGDDALKGLYRTVLHGKRALLLMDNAADARQVEPLTPPSGCALLVTSRRRFHLPGLLVRDLDALSSSDAVTLLRSIAPRVDGEAVEIAALCGHLPLAVRLAGTLLAVRDDLTPTNYLGRLRKARLSERSGLSEVATAIRLSEELLPEPLRTRWRELALLVGGFEAAWAAALWDVEADDADDWLGVLRGNSLVDWDDKTQFYRLHDLVREYLDAELVWDIRQQAAWRHARHFAAELSAADDAYLKGGAAIAEGLRRFDRAWPNGQAAFAWMQQHLAEHEEVARLGVRLVNWCPYVRNLRQHPRDQIHWLETALQAARQLKYRAAEGNTLGNLGNAYAALGQPQRAIDFYQEALVISREIGDRRGEGNTLGSLGNAYAALGQPQRAIDFYQEALVISREIGDCRGEGSDLGNLGVAYAALGQPQRAIDFLQKALVIDREIGNRLGESDALDNLGNAYAALGQLQRAIDFHQEALIISREIGDRRGEGAALGNLGIAYKSLGQPERAIDFYQQYLAIAREIGDRQGEARASWNMGLQLVKLDRVAEAIPLMESCVAFEKEIGDPDAEKDAARVESLRRRLADEGHE